MNSIDWGIIIFYLLAVVGIGMAAGMISRKNERGGEGGGTISLRAIPSAGR